MSTTRRWPISFAGSSVLVEAVGEPAVALAGFLFDRAPLSDEQPADGHFRLLWQEQTGWELYHNNELAAAESHLGALPERLLGDVCHELAEHSRGGLLFHAGGLGRGGRGVLLPGGIGSGKTTLSAWLACRGLDYLTDEMVFIPTGAETMQTFTRPLNLKNPSVPVLQEWIDLGRPDERIVRGPHSCLVGPSLLGSTRHNAPLPLGLFLFPGYRPGVETAVELLSPARVGLALMETLVNARNLPGHGFDEVARVAGLAPGYRLEYAGFRPLAEPLERLLQQLIP